MIISTKLFQSPWNNNILQHASCKDLNVQLNAQTTNKNKLSLSRPPKHRVYTLVFFFYHFSAFLRRLLTNLNLISPQFVCFPGLVRVALKALMPAELIQNANFFIHSFVRSFVLFFALVPFFIRLCFFHLLLLLLAEKLWVFGIAVKCYQLYFGILSAFSNLFYLTLSNMPKNKAQQKTVKLS